MPVVCLACYAMRTRFELVLVGDNERWLRAAGEEALNEIVALERLLSRFRPDSDIGRINALASRQPVRVDARTFRLLQRALQLSQATDGAFDITVAPLLRCWGVSNQRPSPPTPKEIAHTLSFIGSHHILLDETAMTVRLAKDGVQLDLGGIGKGYALERVAGILREVGVEHALLHGGTSSVYAFGHDPDGNAWRIAIAHPESGEPLTILPIDNCGLSVSAVNSSPHTPPTINPFTGNPVQHTLLAAVVLPSPTDAEAWSTALLVLGKEGLTSFRQRHPDGTGLVVDADGQVWQG